MDGNGRWGLKHKNSRNLGHKEGLKTVEMVMRYCIKKKIKFLTLYAFSTENWKRPLKERNYLFRLLEIYLIEKLEKLNDEKIKIKILGEKIFSYKLNSLLDFAEKKTIRNTKLQINLALNYGSKKELVYAFNRLKKKIGLKYELENNINLISFKNNKIEISFNQNLDRNFIKDLTSKLLDWTGERWIILLSKEAGLKSIKEIETESKENKIDYLKNSKDFKKAINIFPDLEVTSIKDLKRFDDE